MTPPTPRRPPPPPLRQPPGEGSDSRDRGAYLVLQTAGRWSDVFRLTVPGEAVIGRASSNQIVVRSDQASRRHAKIFYASDRWLLEDLGSRNGTRVNRQPVSDPHPLSDGDVIEVAGFAIGFAHQIDAALSSPGGAAPSDDSAQATDDQITMGIDLDSITDRQQHSSHLHGGVGGPALTVRSSRALLHLAFAVARADTFSAAAEEVLDALTHEIEFDSAGLYTCRQTPAPGGGSEAERESLTLAATRQQGNHSYHRPPQAMLDSVAGDRGHAILARNVHGDRHLATADGRGASDVDSVIIAPVRDHGGRLLGAIHVTAGGETAPLASEDLEFVVAAGEILGSALAGLFDRQQLAQSLNRSRRQVRQLRDQLADRVRIIGNSAAIGQVIEQISLIAPTDSTVLIRGESGVGKELVAAAIHHGSGRSEGPLVCLNCAALSPTLLESELFGHEKGAFTGATDRKLGKFELADGGTLMLDEIGEMSTEIQAKFLRVLEGHRFERVGGQQAISADVRVVAATHCDLQSMVAAGQFRQDLYYRLHVIEITVPPLRERGHDCLQLAEYFLQQFNRETGRQIAGFTAAAQQRLRQYAWPGNVRELKNVVERAVVLNTTDRIDAADLLLSPTTTRGDAQATTRGDAQATNATFRKLSLAELERLHIEQVLRHTAGNKSRAAAILGIERSTLDRKLKKYQASGA